MLTSTICHIWILENPSEPLGQVRYDVKYDMADIDISIVPAFRRYGLGKYLIFQTLPLLVEKHPTLKGLVAKVRTNNFGSKRLFRSIGFTQCQQGGIETWAIPILKED